MPDGLYDRDILAWSEQQAGLLRRLAAGERLNEAVDWTNVIDEVETVGRSELHACEGLIEQALEHLVKLGREPDNVAAGHLRDETVAFLARARRRFAPSMRRLLDLEALYAGVRRAKDAELGRREGAGLPGACPFTLDDLLAEDPDLPRLAALLGPAGP